MGDWQDGYDAGLWGIDGIPYGIDSPCWNDDWEHDLRADGYKTVAEWNSIGRSVKKAKKAYIFHVQKYVYSVNHKQQLAIFLTIAMSIKIKSILKHLKMQCHGRKKILEKLSPEHLMEMDTSKNEWK